MTARVHIEKGTLDDWVGWEPVLRALLDGRKVYETGDVDFRALDGAPLDLDRAFTPDDDREEISHFLHEAGFLHLRGIFDEVPWHAGAGETRVGHIRKKTMQRVTKLVEHGNHFVHGE